jgi:RimJ/RimL family protein N-acetyltransferase
LIAARSLEGRSVRLRPLRVEHAELEARWLSDAEVRHWLHRSEDGPEQRTRGSVARKIAEGLASPLDLRFLIETAEGVPIGQVALLGIHPHGRAELSILIGERGYWSRGLGADAIRCLVGFAFAELGLRRVTLITDADNVRGVRCYENCGFRHEGVLRAHRLRHGAPIDMLAMAVLRGELRDVAGEPGGG